MQESSYLKVSARVAQLVEQLICNQLVGGSSPFSGSFLQYCSTYFYFRCVHKKAGENPATGAGSRAAKWGGL